MPPPENNEPEFTGHVPAPIYGPDPSGVSLSPTGFSSLSGVNREWSENALLQPPADARSASVGGLFKAFCQRWLLALGVGLLLGFVCATAMWFLKPARYTAYALLRVAA